jgi:hypothetical protein
MIIHTRSPEVIVYALRRLPEIDAPDALRRMVEAMVAQSQNFRGLAQQVVAHAGGKAGVEATRNIGSSVTEVRFYVPPSAIESNRAGYPGAWMACLQVEVKVLGDDTESYFFALQVRHDNPNRDVRMLAAALIAEDERKCTTTVSFEENSVHNLTHALQLALMKI